jgi:hypothetical protein
MNSIDVKCYWSEFFGEKCIIRHYTEDQMKLLAMVTNQHFAMSDSHALLTQHVVERCSAEM